MAQLKRVQVDGRTYETDLNLQVGDKVLMPTPYWLQDVKGPTYQGVVTSLESGGYTGQCVKIISKVK